MLGTLFTYMTRVHKTRFVNKTRHVKPCEKFRNLILDFLRESRVFANRLLTAGMLLIVHHIFFLYRTEYIPILFDVIKERENIEICKSQVTYAVIFNMF